jgi:hypothetical protein
MKIEEKEGKRKRQGKRNRERKRERERKLNIVFLTRNLSNHSRTVASALNSLAAITCEDIVRGIFQKDLSASKGAIYARWISIFFGAFSFALIFVVERLGSVLQVDFYVHCTDVQHKSRRLFSGCTVILDSLFSLSFDEPCFVI